MKNFGFLQELKIDTNKSKKNQIINLKEVLEHSESIAQLEVEES